MKLIVVCIAIGLVALATLAAEDACTSAVRRAVEAAHPGARVKACSPLNEDGTSLIEATLRTRDGRDLVMDFAPDGTLMQTEEAIRVDAVPSAVLDALLARYQKAKPKAAERMVKADGGVEYEISFTSGHGWRRKEATISSQGTIIGEEPARSTSR